METQFTNNKEISQSNILPSDSDQMGKMMQMMAMMNASSNVANMPKDASNSRIPINIFCTKCKQCGPTRI